MAATLTARVTNMNGQIVAEKRGGQHRVLNSDPLGNVVDVRDSAGTQLASYNFWPYGEVRTSTGSISNPWMFCGVWGYYNDGSTYYVRARTYRPDLTRWLTADELWPGEPAYGGMGSSPLVNIDWSGYAPVRLEFYAFIHKKHGKWGDYPIYHDPKTDPIWKCQYKADARNFDTHPTSRLWFDHTLDSTKLGRYPYSTLRSSNHIGSTTRRCKPRFKRGGWEESTRNGEIRYQVGGIANTGPCTSVFWSITAGTEGFLPLVVPWADGAIWFEVHFIVSASKICVNGENHYFINIELEGGHTLFPDFEGYGTVTSRKELYRQLSPFPRPDFDTLGSRHMKPFYGAIKSWRVSASDVPPWCA